MAAILSESTRHESRPKEDSEARDGVLMAAKVEREGEDMAARVERGEGDMAAKAGSRAGGLKASEIGGQQLRGRMLLSSAVGFGSLRIWPNRFAWTW